MPKHRLSMSPKDWPEDIRARFNTVFASASERQHPRLEQGLGRWLLAAQQDDLPPELITPALLARRLGYLRPEMQAAARQALQAVFPEANAFARNDRIKVESKRAALQREIQRNWHRLPPAWRDAAKPKLYFCPEGVSDGLLVEAWTTDTLQSRLQTTWLFFDYCRAHNLAEDVTRETAKSWLDHRQQGFKAGEVSIATIRGELQRLKLLGSALFPDRKWGWFDPVLGILKKKQALQPSRNDARIVDLAELREAAFSCAKVALEHHQSVSGYKKRTSSNKLARTGLALSLLVNSPIRCESLANLDLRENFDTGFTRLYLSPQETKDKKRDERILSPDVQRQLRDYIEHHRAVVAPAQETALFVGSRGKPVASGYLSQTLGDQCQKLFGKRVTPQVIRNIVAGFIVSQAPEKASLASVVLNHSCVATIETYRANGKQIQAAKKLRESNDHGREAHGVEAAGSEKPEKGRARVRPSRPARERRQRLGAKVA